MHAKYANLDECVRVVRTVCTYIEAQVKQPPFRQTKNLHTMILAAYNCLTYAITVMPSVVNSTSALREIVRAVALGLTGSVLDSKLVEPEWSITTSGPRRLFASRFRDSTHVSTRSPSFRVQEAAVTLFNHLLGTNQKAGTHVQVDDSEIAREYGFKVQRLRYFVVDEKAIVGVVIPDRSGDPPEFESFKDGDHDGVLLIIRDDVGKYVWRLSNTDTGHFPRGGSETPGFRAAPMPPDLTPLDDAVDDTSGNTNTNNNGSGDTDAASGYGAGDDRDDDGNSSVAATEPQSPGIGSSGNNNNSNDNNDNNDGVSLGLPTSSTTARVRMLSRGSIELPAGTLNPTEGSPRAEPLPAHTAASIDKCRRDLMATDAFDAVSKAWDEQLRDDSRRRDTLTNVREDADDGEDRERLREDQHSAGGGGGALGAAGGPHRPVDMSPIAFLAHLGGLQPNTDDTRTPMGRFREIVCPVKDIETSLQKLDLLTYDHVVDVTVVCLKPEGECVECYATTLDGNRHKPQPDSALPEKFVEFFALLCQSAPNHLPPTVRPERFVWETLVLNIVPKDTLPSKSTTMPTKTTAITVVWAANSSQLTEMAQRIQTPAVIVCPLPDGLYLTSVYSGTERAPAFLTYAIPLSGRILHEMLCRAISNLALELVWGTDGYVFPHHRRQRNIESVIKALAPLSTTASALHEFIATNMSSTVDQGGSESETKDRAQPHVTFEATAEVVDSAA
eukprot:m.133992 g.133992  ORF g.133992 m.133992 type:complete len:730 (-) comp11373_c0_seq2:1685-3874(-)